MAAEFGRVSRRRLTPSPAAARLSERGEVFRRHALSRVCAVDDRGQTGGPAEREAARALGLVMRSVRGSDFPLAREVVDAWFGRPVGLTMHRLFFEQLGPSGVWLERDGRPAGFLLGLISEAEPNLAYIHFHAVDPSRRRQGLGRLLYRAFGHRACSRGCTRVRALAAPTNVRSLRFHEALGFVGRFASQYVGPGQDRVVFERDLPFEEEAPRNDREG